MWEPCRPPSTTVQPRVRNGGTLGTHTVWACTVSLAATPAPFYFLRVREMFQFPGLPPHRLCVHRRVTRLTTLRGFPIRTSSAPSPRAAPRGISLLRHVLLRHERPRHPPDALCHGHLPTRGRPRRRTPVPRPCCHTIQSILPTYAPPQSRAHAFTASLVSTPRLLTCFAAVLDCCLTTGQAASDNGASKENGGDEETRTPDPLRAKEVLSQLSYIPKRGNGGRFWIRTRDLTLIRGVL